MNIIPWATLFLLFLVLHGFEDSSLPLRVRVSTLDAASMTKKPVMGSFKTYFLPKSIQKHLRYKWGWITNVFLQGETSRQFSHIKVYLCSPLISDPCSWSSRSWVCYKPDLLHAIWWPQQLLLEWNVQYVLLRWHCVCLPRGSWAKDGTFDFISALGRWWWFSKVN